MKLVCVNTHETPHSLYSIKHWEIKGMIEHMLVIFSKPNQDYVVLGQ